MELGGKQTGGEQRHNSKVWKVNAMLSWLVSKTRYAYKRAALRIHSFAVLQRTVFKENLINVVYKVYILDKVNNVF